MGKARKSLRICSIALLSLSGLGAFSRNARASSSRRIVSLFIERSLRAASWASHSFKSAGIFLINRVASFTVNLRSIHLDTTMVSILVLDVNLLLA